MNFRQLFYADCCPLCGVKRSYIESVDSYTKRCSICERFWMINHTDVSFITQMRKEDRLTLFEYLILRKLFLDADDKKRLREEASWKRRTDAKLVKLREKYGL